MKEMRVCFDYPPKGEKWITLVNVPRKGEYVNFDSFSGIVEHVIHDITQYRDTGYVDHVVRVILRVPLDSEL